jgi:hypothetical protein
MLNRRTKWAGFGFPLGAMGTGIPGSENPSPVIEMGR